MTDTTESLERRLGQCLEPSGPIVAAYKLQELANDMLATLKQRGEENERLRKAIEDIFAMMDEGLLVRNIEHDGEADWALRNMKLVMRLKEALAALEGEDES